MLFKEPIWTEINFCLKTVQPFIYKKSLSGLIASLKKIVFNQNAELI